jgi:spermidine synthase
MARESRWLAWVGLMVGLVLSGTAGIVNQVLWQRALKIFLGGSETLSAMVVVLVFLLGLGAGAAIAGRIVPRLANPLRALALVELGLALANAAVMWLLGLDITESVYAMQRLALSSGVPLRGVYALCAALLLAVPTLLMGATLPLASEGCQRQLGAGSSRLVPVLFFVNTVGAAVGAWYSSALLLPWIGQRASLLVAVACNVTAAACIGLLVRSPDAAPGAIAPPRAARGLSREELLGGLLGFLSLGWEMVLFRLLTLAHHPWPTTFATALAAYLLAWSLGVALAGWRPLPAAIPILGTGALIGGAVYVLRWQMGLHEKLPLWLTVSFFSLPCVGFGCSYGQLVSRAATAWGRDVGRFSAVNTLGSCAGIVFFTLVGYEISQTANMRVLAWGFIGVGLLELAWGGESTLKRRHALGLAAVAFGGALVSLVVGLRAPYSVLGGVRTYWGRDGVVGVTREGNVWIDGLWHTALSNDGDQVGSPHSWLMAFAGVAAHGERPRRALVVGGGVGISSGSLSGVDGLEIDVYEINNTLKDVHRDYPEGTLRAFNDPARVDWRWQDARTGLALDPTVYDVILSAPLYLRQAGSSQLLSREYLRLLKSRLAPDGVAVVYSNEYNPSQARLVQATLAEAFAHRATWHDGLITVCSNRPIALTKKALRDRLSRPDRLFAEAKSLDAKMRDRGGLWSWYEGEKRVHDLADRVITDDQPLLEYQELAERLVGTAPRRK